MFQVKTRLLSNQRISGKYFRLALACPQIARQAQAGQFVNIKVADDIEPLLRRPFSIYRLNSKGIEVIYEVLGQGTEILSSRKKGEFLDIIGPLGNGFNIGNYYLPILVAGGMGIAPLFFLAQRLAEYGIRNTEYGITVLIGAKTKKQILCEKEFKDLGLSVKIATDDGSRGFKGKVTELLKDILRSTKYEARSTIYACGPRPMLREISRIVQKYNIPAQISLEAHLACGIGACLGCVVKTKDGLKRACSEGPVFKASQIIWE